MMNTKSIGDIGEKLAVKLLKSKKFKILSRNLHKGRNELDIIAQNRDHIVFVEVKTRNSLAKGLPREAVTPTKQRTIIRCAQLFVLENKINGAGFRFDVIEVTNGEINHIIDAFRA